MHERPFDQMTAAEHRAAAAHENAAADREYAAARGELRAQSPMVPAGEIPYEGPSYPFFAREWDPMEPEYYTIDSSPRVAGEGHADAARRHRNDAERHERAAVALEQRRRG